MKNKASLILIAVSMFFVGCATTQERLLDSDSSQVQLRVFKPELLTQQINRKL